MDEEIIRFYEDLAIPISQLIKVGVQKKALKPENIENAAVNVFRQVRLHKIEPNPRKLTPKIFELARIESLPDGKIRRLKEKIKNLEEELHWHKKPWIDKLMWRFYNDI